MGRLARIVIPLAVLGIGGLTAFSLWASRPVVEPSAPAERVWLVSAQTVEIADVQPDLELFGDIVAGRQVELRAFVAGPVLEAGPALVEGGIVRRGEMILRIDPFDYQAVLDERLAMLSEARARLVEFEARYQADQAVLARNTEQLTLTARHRARSEKLRARGTVSEKALDDAKLAHSRQEQLVVSGQSNLKAQNARIEQQRAAIKRLEVGVRRARRDLARSRVTAPYDGFVFDTAAEVGKRISVNDRIARLVDAGRLEARIHLSDQQYGRLAGDPRGVVGRPVSVLWQAGDRTFDFAAVVDRVGARIDAASGGVDLYARLSGTSVDEPLRPGAFVSLRLPDQLFAAVARVDESALHQGGLVYVIVEGRLEPRRVEVVARVGSDVLLWGELQTGDQVLTTRLSEVGPGVRVEVR
ncbi:MAG TPA: efflux RND transporter periplasmic adaptor subunit [Alphaproteobacteria bacterium]|jgi:RND family efflux transporter MFP subunit|nr:efflux RND transporter periplasmic adaptor subunit [Alphaproteobacteria bacterium]